MGRYRTVRHADQCVGNWSEPEPEFSPADEDWICERAEELIAEGSSRFDAMKEAMQERLEQVKAWRDETKFAAYEHRMEMDGYSQ